MTLHKVAPGCTFESEDEIAMNPVIGRKNSVAVKEPKPYYRTSELDIAYNKSGYQLIPKEDL